MGSRGGRPRRSAATRRRFAMHVKGLEMPGYDPRSLQTMALGLAVGTRGADHNRSGAYEADFSEKADRLRGGPDSARSPIETEDRAAVMDSLILCKFLRGVFADFFAEAAAMLSAVTGWDVTPTSFARSARSSRRRPEAASISAKVGPAPRTRCPPACSREERRPGMQRDCLPAPASTR